MLIRVRGALPSLRPAEQRVAEAVLADPAGVSERSITALARLCRTSETTVLRFCRALGLAGYPELRIALARAAQGEENDRASRVTPDSPISETDSMAEMVAKIAYADQRSIADTGAAVDVAALQAAVDALVGARRVDVYGVGASALVGQELSSRLHRLGRRELGLGGPVRARSPRRRVSRPGDVAVGISHTGTTIDVLDALRVARGRGATTIGITNFDRAPIVGHSDVVLTTAARETTFRTGAMSSRVSQLVLVDCLFTGVAMRSYDRSVVGPGVGPRGAADAAHRAARAPGGQPERVRAGPRPGDRPVTRARTLTSGGGTPRARSGRAAVAAAACPPRPGCGPP